LDQKARSKQRIYSHYRGAWGYFRCSHRELDPKLSTDFQPVQAHRKEEPMEPGEIYPIDIEFYPHSRIWHKGEYMRLEIAGRFIPTGWFEDGHFSIETDNGNGTHVIHTGGEYASYLQIPFIPPKYQSGEYIVR
jgi:predicted acyl esterase